MKNRSLQSVLVRSACLGSVLVLGLIWCEVDRARAAWIDAATGQPVWTNPVSGLTPGTGGDIGAASDHDHAHLPKTGQNLYWDKVCGTWRDAKTGDEVWTNPVSGLTPGTGGDIGAASDHDHAHLPKTGQNLFWQPCPPPPQTAASTGLYLGGELAKNWGWVRSTERLAATDVVTNQFSDHADPFGGGVIVGYKFAPWANNVVLSPFASFDFIHAPVNHTFAGGSFLGTTANFMGTFGVKAGPQLDMGLWLYGIAGVSVLNETLNINFIPVSSSQSAWVAGATVGLGGAWQPAFLQGFGRPVSLFLEYQHTWWQDATFNTPPASPAFNYTFARQDDVVKFGFIVSLDAPPPPPRRALITK